MGMYLMVLFTLYLVPLGMYSPCIKEEGTLGPPPALIGHRGAPMVGLNGYIWCWVWPLLERCSESWM
ncbi:UNVERIFIED_CONTAM: hypothetical protein FKN15_022406 [Acipenser sinensis]